MSAKNWFTLRPQDPEYAKGPGSQGGGPPVPPLDAGQAAMIYQRLCEIRDLLADEGKQDLETFSSVSLLNTGARVYSGALGLAGWYLYNTQATVRYVKFYDIPGTGLPDTGNIDPRLTLAVPPNGGANFIVYTKAHRTPFKNGLAIACTTLAPFNDNTAGSVGDVIVNLWYARATFKPSFTS